MIRVYTIPILHAEWQNQALLSSENNFRAIHHFWPQKYSTKVRRTFGMKSVDVMWCLGCCQLLWCCGGVLGVTRNQIFLKAQGFFHLDHFVFGHHFNKIFRSDILNIIWFESWKKFSIVYTHLSTHSLEHQFIAEENK